MTVLLFPRYLVLPCITGGVNVAVGGCFILFQEITQLQVTKSAS